MIDKDKVLALRETGMSFVDIANALGTTKGTVAGVLFRAQVKKVDNKYIATCEEKDCGEPRQHGRKWCHFHTEEHDKKLHEALFGKAK